MRISDWSSDVCSSDLAVQGLHYGSAAAAEAPRVDIHSAATARAGGAADRRGQAFPDREVQGDLRRSEDLDGGDGHGSHAAGVVSISGVIAWRSAYYSYIAVSDGSEVSAIEVGVGPAVMTPELREAIHADLQHQIAKAVR